MGIPQDYQQSCSVTGNMHSQHTQGAPRLACISYEYCPNHLASEQQEPHKGAGASLWMGGVQGTGTDHAMQGLTQGV